MFLHVVIGIVVIILFIYLFFTIIYPEKFI
ncbi:MAG: K(+)-transporting ATPase subunit F [Parachlamydiales bacterium]|nr:K(+)-transporting ATPase subunit F [Parachlamydiales bacterium]